MKAVVPILQGALRGKKWIVGSGIHRLWLGSYEPDKMALAARLVRPGDEVFDIGANVGIYTLLFSQCVGSSGHVVSFEPEPRNLDFLRRHLQLNASSNVTVIEAAISSSSGASRFEPTKTSSTGHLAAAGSLEVRTIALDEFVTSSGRTPALLKIDVEGAEMDVLLGAEMTITRAHPIVLLATHSEALREACTEFLTRNGYHVRSLRCHGVVAADELLAEPTVMTADRRYP